MQGWLYSSDSRLAYHDLYDLADALAVQLHNKLGPHVFQLHRGDVAELIDPYVCDLEAEDQKALSWLVWHLFQDAHQMCAEATARKKHRRR